MTPAPTAEHRHAWSLVTHVDGCHTYQSAYACECGAHRITFAERAFRSRTPSGLYAILWADDDCERCSALLAGARRRPSRDRVWEAGE